MALVMGGSSPVPVPFSIDNSCRFNNDASLSIVTGTPTSTTKMTFSCWFKMSNIGKNQTLISTNGIGDPYFIIYITSDDFMRAEVYDGSATTKFVTNRVFRDMSSWYHVCFSYDSTPATPSSTSIRLFINGVQETSFSTETYGSQNDNSELDSGSLAIGDAIGESYFWNGYLAEVCVIDGTAYVASDFGEFDTDSPGSWIPKKVSTLTFGDIGGYLDFKDSANMGNDSSANANDYTENSIDATDQATDTPNNNFSTLNPLINVNSTAAYPANYFEGACRLVPSGDWVSTVTTWGAYRSKWYAEIEYDSAVNVGIIGIIGEDAVGTGVDSLSNNLGFQTSCVGYLSDNRVFISGSGAAAPGATYGSGDIIQIALDLDNGNVYFGLNGTWLRSGDPESGATGTGAYAIGGPANQYWFFSCGPYSATASMECNFGGCPAFTVASSNSDTNGYGSFEYPVPAGYYSLCSKNQAEVG